MINPATVSNAELATMMVNGRLAQAEAKTKANMAIVFGVLMLINPIFGWNPNCADGLELAGIISILSGGFALARYFWIEINIHRVVAFNKRFNKGEAR